MQQNYPFQPNSAIANTAALTITATSTTFALSTFVGADGGTVRIVNAGTQTVFFNFGSVTASVTTSMPILANSVESFSWPAGATSISAIAAATGSLLYVTTGIGS